MASTYSTNLKIELIATGEQAGTWGSTTNTNLGTALEQSIVGYGNPNFTTDADLTISLTDSNATQTARNLALNVTSSVSLTTTRNLIVPTIQKPYIIRNNTTGSQSIVVKTSAGTGVTVPNGTYLLVYVDGTNVVPQISQMPVQYGGTGATTLTANNVILGNGTSAVQFVAPGTSGNVLTSNGSSWSSAAPAGFASGTVMLFAQTSAPTGWTKLTTRNNYALRVVTGAAGNNDAGVGFTTAFASQSVSGTVGNTTLTTAQMPSHSHTATVYPITKPNGYFGASGLATGATTATTDATGGGGSHNHSFTGTAINLAVNYVDVIQASRD